MKNILPLLLLIVTIASGVLLAQQAQPSHQGLTNDDLQAMLRVGVEEKVLLEAISTNPAAYDKSPEAIANLRKSGASDRVIAALIAAPAVPVFVTPAKAKYPTEVGIYAERDGKFTEIEPEVTNWKTGGFWKSMATAGMYMGHVNGTVRNPHSENRLTTASSIVIYCQEGVSATEYQLLKLHEKGNRREFKAMTMWVVHATGGPSKGEEVEVHAEKVAPRTYRLSLQGLKAGEYGFLPPGAVTSASQASTGKIYSFGVME